MDFQRILKAVRELREDSDLTDADWARILVHEGVPKERVSDMLCHVKLSRAR